MTATQATQATDNTQRNEHAIKEMSSLAWEIYIRDRESSPDFAYNRALGWIKARERLGLGMPSRNEPVS